MERLKAALNWLRINDEQGRLSLTNVALTVALVKLATAAQVGVADIGALLLTLLHYSGRTALKARIAAQETPQQAGDDMQQLAAAQAQLTKQVESLKAAVTVKNAFGK